MPKPVLQAMVLADHVYRDGATGKHVIAGTFTRIWFGKAKVDQPGDSEESAGRRVVSGPISKAGSPYLYIALVAVHGQVPLDLKYIDLSDASVLIEAQIVVGARDPVAVAEYVVPIPPLPANKVGNYSLDLLYENEILGSWRVSVQELKQQNNDEGGAQQ